MNLTEIYKLSADKPNHTNEIHLPNDFYGHAAILKKYANYPPDYKIKASIEHGIFFGGFVWEVDLNAALPAMIVPGRFRETILRKHTKKKIYSMGPMLAYAPHYLSQNCLNSEKKRLGKNLLVFPYHSTHWLKSTYDIKAYCSILEQIGKDFNSIRVCLYWKDVLHGLAEKYMSYGFECVTAGHMYDPMFLPRLKSIIETATVTSSQGVGTQLGYCIIMNKPHFIIEQSFEYIYGSQNVPKVVKEQRKVANTFKDKPDVKELIRTFSEIRDDITLEQKGLVDQYWGISEFKSSREVREIFEVTEDEYNQPPYNRKKISFNIGLKDLHNKDIIIFGTGQMGADTFKVLQTNSKNNSNIDVMAFMDNDKLKWGQDFCKRKVLKPNYHEIKKADKIIIASCWYCDIKQQLLDMGVPVEKILFSEDLFNMS